MHDDLTTHATPEELVAGERHAGDRARLLARDLPLGRAAPP